MLVGKQHLPAKEQGNSFSCDSFGGCPAILLYLCADGATFEACAMATSLAMAAARASDCAVRSFDCLNGMLTTSVILSSAAPLMAVQKVYLVFNCHVAFYGMLSTHNC